jgi:drug/metabolite transporter (DMT)-like permease
LWNSGFIGAEYALPYTGSFTLVFWRYLALTLIIMVYLVFRNRFRWVGRKTAALNMLIGILSHGVWLSCVLLALEYKIPAGIVALVVALQPLATGALSGSVTGERTHMLQWLGLLIGFVGVAIPIVSRMTWNNDTPFYAYLIPLGAVIGITVASLIQRRMEVKSVRHKLPLDQTMFYHSLGTTLVLAFPAILSEQLSTQWETTFIFVMLWLIFAVSLGAYLVMWLLIERINATRVASLFYLGPPVTMLMAWLAFGDTIKIIDIIGLAIVFAGVGLTQIKNSLKSVESS